MKCPTISQAKSVIYPILDGKCAREVERELATVKHPGISHTMHMENTTGRSSIG